MAKINFDPELMRNIKIIYGDANLDGMTLQNIYETWQRNPEIIRNTARQKMGNLGGPKPSGQMASTMPQKTIQTQQQEIADDDLRGIQGFGAAFREARKRGLKQFRWGKGVYGTQLDKKEDKEKNKGSDLKQGKSNRKTPIIEIGTPIMNNPYVTYNQNKTQATTYIDQVNQELGEPTGVIFERWVKTPDTDMWGRKLTPEQIQNGRSWDRVAPVYVRQQGGTMNNQQELQKAFMAYLIQDAQTQGIQIQSEQDLQAYAEQLGEEGIKAKYQEFMQKMQGGVMARLGAKLEYYKKLKGVCPEGEEMVYFKQGGRICKACQKAQKGTPGIKKENEVDKFKKGRQQFKKDMSSAKDEASRDSIAINKYNDQETMSNKGNKGNFRNNKWVPDRTKYTKKNECGSKMKKR